MPEVPPIADAAPSQETPQEHSEPHPGESSGVPNTEARWLTPPDPDSLPTQALPSSGLDPLPVLEASDMVDLTGEDDQPGRNLEEIVPTTPPELAEPTEPLPVLPAKRPFDALVMDVKARRVTNSSFELFNYQSKFARPLTGLG